MVGQGVGRRRQRHWRLFQRRQGGQLRQRAFQLATEVDESGRVILDTTTLERAELKRDQIHAFGRDWRVPACEGSMYAQIEPSEG